MSNNLPKVAWIGLGIMGSPMSENLIKAGYDVTGYTLEQDKIDRLVAAGGTGASSIADAVEDADVVITMVPASPQVEAIAYGPDGILENARRGALLVDMSSITPQTSVDLAEKAAEKGIRVLDAPVSGGEAGAIEAVLSIMVGGEQADFDTAKPLLEALGKTIVLCGPHGSGQTVKAANQLIVAVNIQACAEAVVFLEKSGVDLTAALDVLNGGLAGSTVLTRKKDNFLKRDFAPGFRIDLHHKDMGIVTDAAATSARPCPSAVWSPSWSPRCAPRATAASTTRRCCARSSGSPAPRSDPPGSARSPAPRGGRPARPPARPRGHGPHDGPPRLRVAVALTPVLSRPGAAATRNHILRFQQTVDVAQWRIYAPQAVSSSYERSSRHMAKRVLTTESGAPVADNQNSASAGLGGPLLLQDQHLLEKLARFNRERIPERVVHARGSGAYGYFEVTDDVTGFTRADFLSEVGKRTETFIRFSTVADSLGGADAVRDPRGFALKFYTDEGNYDLVGNNTPVFFIKDPIKFPDFIHSQKRDPFTGRQEPDNVWDFWAHSPRRRTR